MLDGLCVVAYPQTLFRSRRIEAVSKSLRRFMARLILVRPGELGDGLLGDGLPSVRPGELGNGLLGDGLPSPSEIALEMAEEPPPAEPPSDPPSGRPQLGGESPGGADRLGEAANGAGPLAASSDAHA